MDAFTLHTGVVVPLDRPNVDTDQIIPKQFLKRIERDGFGEYLFFDWRYLPDGAPNPEFEFNQDRYRDASILLAGRNFGCGSSREHAVWALHNYGVRAVLAPSFADIFYSNCFNNALLPVTIPEQQVEELADRTRRTPGYRLTVDLKESVITDTHGLWLEFTLEPFRRYRLLNGLDDIGLTLEHEDAISAYERRMTAEPVTASIE
ncbi:MAG: 3-isopropylmalate dehydratase small subunit [Chloroflexota bacterium]